MENHYEVQENPKLVICIGFVIILVICIGFVIINAVVLCTVFWYPLVAMFIDDIIYISLLIISVPCGLFIRRLPDASHRQLYSSVLGFIIALIVSGVHIIHPVILTLINAFIILHIDRRVCHVVSFVFCFVYLAFFRTTEYFGIPSPPPHTNAIQMILTLKMVGLAYEVKGELLSSTKADASSIPAKDQLPVVTITDIFQYSFCLGGVLIGPYYKYRTYWDMLHAPYTSSVPVIHFLKRRFCVVPLYVLLFLVGDYLFPLDIASSEDILKESLIYRIFYMTPLFFNFRMRIYAGFVLGECVCISLGLGAYPKVCAPQPGAGPTNYSALQEIENNTDTWSKIEYSFETIKNVDEYSSEFLPTIREGIRSWNRTVQYWLASFVYKKLSASKPVKMVIVMLVSSFWHGVHLGYYLCLMSAPLFLIVEAEAEKAFKKSATRTQAVIFDWIWWVIKMQSFGYMGLAFQLLDTQACLRYWKSIYFIGHIFILIVYYIAYSKNKKRRKEMHGKDHAIKAD